MKQVKKVCIALLLLVGMNQAYADEGMWVLKELNAQNLERMKELGFNAPFERLYNDSLPCVANAVVIFGGGCTGITVSEEGLIFTNHHCGFSAIQNLSSVTHDYLRDGFISQTRTEELPVSDLSVRYLKETVDVSERILSAVEFVDDEYRRVTIADSISQVICDSIGTNRFLSADVIPFYSHNKYYVVVYEVYRDVRLVFAPPSSVGKFGGDTDNWMWPRHTGDFSVFRVYANTDNQPAEYATDNRPYRPKYVAEVSLQGYQDKDYAMTLGFPGSTERNLSSWGVEQRIENSNKPRIEVRGIKQDIWKEAMLANDALRIKYASKYAESSNYWKNSIGMNRGLANLHVIERKKAEEAAFTAWTEQTPERKAKYGDVLNLLEKGYTSTGEYQNYATYLLEAFAGGTEVIRLARMVGGVDMRHSSPEEIDELLEEQFRPFFKNYDPALDQKVVAAMMEIVKKRVPADYLPDIYRKIDKKYKGDYKKYAADVFKTSPLLSYEGVATLLKDKKLYDKMMKNDPAIDLYLSALFSMYDIQQTASSADSDIDKGERLYLTGLQEMYPERNFYSDANFTMRLSYGSIGGYHPYDATWYNYYSTEKGVLEKEDATNDEFLVQPEIINLLENKDFAPYANSNGELQLCFLTNNDITGGNSGSPILDKHTRLIGLAFDGNWEAMSGDIAFEPDLQRCIGVDIRYVLYIIDKWGKCPRLIHELKLVN
ncbi:MAG: S46 family peptidase [Tannerella sp.]|nr:S46 family peptidase [Tannerella sp.]